MGRLYQGDVVNETFVPAKDSQMHCPLPTFDAWRALPVYERYHPPIAPSILPTSFGYHCNTTEMCWYTGGRAVKDNLTYVVSRVGGKGGSYKKLLAKWRMRCYHLELRHPDSNLCVLH